MTEADGRPQWVDTEDHAAIEEWMTQTTRRHAQEMRVLHQRIHTLTEEMELLQNENSSLRAKISDLETPLVGWQTEEET